MSGDANVIIEARAALLDAALALQAHRDSIVLIGAQAVYLRTGAASFALAEATKDCDFAIDARHLGKDPRLEDAMRSAGFIINPTTRQPGAWVSPRGIPVDLMIPEQLAGGSGRRSVRIPPHHKSSARRAVGLEASVLDHSWMTVDSLDDDERSVVILVAGPRQRSSSRSCTSWASERAPQIASTTRTPTTATDSWSPRPPQTWLRRYASFSMRRSHARPPNRHLSTCADSSQTGRTRLGQ